MRRRSGRFTIPITVNRARREQRFPSEALDVGYLASTAEPGPEVILGCVRAITKGGESSSARVRSASLENPPLNV